jgi:hypothetical protein
MPSAAEKWPAEQLLHAVWPVALWYVPLPHFLHADAAAVAETEPVRQLVHDPAPVAVTNLPALQFKQVVAPLAL